jgi:hypothetical protein
MFYTAAWCASDESSFRRELPFELLGESLKRHRSGLPFHIVMLEGMELLSAAYLRTLEDAGFTVIDHTAGFKKIVAAYPNIDRQFSRYERNCLLRWIAFAALFDGHPDKPEQFWHLDADILLHTSLDGLVRDTAGKTFLLQGCPVLVTVSNNRWFRLYETQLKALDRDPAGYSAAAAAEKSYCLANDRSLANRCAYRNPIGSDQDLLQYLVSSGRLPQDGAPAIYRSRYFFVENPLSFNVPGFDMQGEHPVRFSMQGNTILTAGKKQVPFLHFQNDFARYAQVWLVLRSWRTPESLIRRVMRYRIGDNSFHRTLAFRIIARLWFAVHPQWGRSHLVKSLLSNKRGRTPADLLNFLVNYSTAKT